MKKMDRTSTLTSTFALLRFILVLYIFSSVYGNSEGMFAWCQFKTLQCCFARHSNSLQLILTSFFLVSVRILRWPGNFVIDLMCNTGDALITFKKQLSDPYNVLQSWDPSHVNPCTWFYVSCNSNGSVTRL